MLLKCSEVFTRVSYESGRSAFHFAQNNWRVNDAYLDDAINASGRCFPEANLMVVATGGEYDAHGARDKRLCTFDPVRRRWFRLFLFRFALTGSSAIHKHNFILYYQSLLFLAQVTVAKRVALVSLRKIIKNLLDRLPMRRERDMLPSEAMSYNTQGFRDDWIGRIPLYIR